MVPLGQVFGTAFAQFREELAKCVSGTVWPTPEAGFLRYIGAQAMPEHEDVLLAVRERLSEGPILASSGYLYGRSNFVPGKNFNEDWCRALDRLLQRDPFPVDRESYFYRPLEILGISLGATHCPGVPQNARDRLRQVLQDGQIRVNEHDVWNYSLTSFAAWKLGVSWKRESLPLIEHLSLDEVCLLRWLSIQDDFANKSGLYGSQKTLDDRIVRSALTELTRLTSAARAGVTLVISTDVVDARISAELERTWSTSANALAAEDVISNLLRRFHVFVLQIRSRHDERRTIEIEDEYDVQDLLHSLLKLHFEDVRPEEWTPSYAGYSTRMDFLLKREKIVVEAKMTRKGLDQKGILQELSEDIERYRSHPECKTLFCFVYDPENYCKNPVALEDDLGGQRDGIRVVVRVFPKP